MAYSPHTWVNGDATRPLSAQRLTEIETGISDAHALIGSSVSIIWFDGTKLPLRSTVTSDPTQTVFWASPLSYPPPAGNGYAITGVDFWLVIP